MQADGPATKEEPAEVVHYFRLWRGIANLVGNGPYDEPVWVDGDLFLRSDYSQKLSEWPEWAEFGDWGAWIVSPRQDGYTRVLHSIKHERQSQRTQRVEAMFTRFSDAGKYIILRIGDSVRSSKHIRLRTLFVEWESRGLDPRIHADPANQDIVDIFQAARPSLHANVAEKSLKIYRVDDGQTASAIALNHDQPRMQILVMSLGELTAALLEGMPESITSQVDLWRE